MDTVLPNKRIDRQQCLWIERVLVSRRQVERDDPLPLILIGLIQGIWNLEPVSGEE